MEEGTWESDSLDLMCCLLINLMPVGKEARLREAEVRVMPEVSYRAKSRASGQSSTYL